MKSWTRRSHWAAVALASMGLLTPAAGAAVISRDLDQQLVFTDAEVLVGTILSVRERLAPEVDGELVNWTLVDLEVEQRFLTADKAKTVTVVFRGGVLPGSPTTTVAPSPQDIQVGRRLLLFLAKNPFLEGHFGKDILQIHSFAEVYRIEKDVVLGKGAGFAFETNRKVAQARADVLAAHARVQAAKNEGR